MKKVLAVLLASAMLFASAVFAAPEETEKTSGVMLEGYVAGNHNGAVLNEWVGFLDTDPTEITVYDSQLSTYAAACRGNFVYGYIYGYDASGVLHDDFYRMSLKDHSIEYVEGASSNGEFVYGMAYCAADDTVYALCDEDHPYIASVDISTGALTRVTTIDLGSYLGVYTFAVDSTGEFYCLTLSALSSRLVRVDRQTGALTVLFNTGYDCYYGQSMTYDPGTNRIYWAHADYGSTSKNGLYYIDMSDYSITYCGVIGTDMEIMGLYVAPVGGGEPEGLLGDVNCDGEVTFADVSTLIAYIMNSGTVSEQGLINADANGDGIVDILDAPAIYAIVFGN